MEERGLIRLGTHDFGPLIRARSGDPVEVIDDGGQAPVFIATAGVGLAVVFFTDLIPLVMPLRALLCLGWVAACGSLPWLVSDWRRRARITHIQRTPHVREVPDGGDVRISGTIESIGEVFRVVAGERSAVYARTVFFVGAADGTSSSEAREDLRGVPFRLRLQDGTVVNIDPTSVRLVDQAHAVTDLTDRARRALEESSTGGRIQAGSVRQALLAPGDTVEVAGRLVRVVSPEAEAAPARGVPIGFRLAPADDGHVWIRQTPSLRRLLRRAPPPR